MDKIDIPLVEEISGAYIWYDEAVVPNATEEEVESIRPYIPVIHPALTEYVNAVSPYNVKGFVFVHDITYAHIFFHKDKHVQMKMNVIDEESYRHYEFIADFQPFYDKYKHLIQTIQSAVAKDKQREMKKRQAALQQKQKRIQRYQKIAESMNQLANMQMERVQKIEQVIDKVQEAMNSIAFVQEQAERLQLQKMMYEKTLQIEQARAERQKAAEQVQQLQKEKGMLQKAKELLHETKEAAKNIFNKAVEGAKSIGKAIKGFFKGDAGKADSAGDKGKGNDAGGPDL